MIYRSEGYLLNLPRCEQFSTHLARNLGPLVSEEMNFKRSRLRAGVKEFALKLRRLAQESVIAFPRSASLVKNSPKFNEFLRIAIEK